MLLGRCCWCGRGLTLNTRGRAAHPRLCDVIRTCVDVTGALWEGCADGRADQIY